MHNDIIGIAIAQHKQVLRTEYTLLMHGLPLSSATQHNPDKMEMVPDCNHHLEISDRKVTGEFFAGGHRD